MAIVRIPNSMRFGRAFTLVDADVNYDIRLSYKARGIYSNLIGRPDHWTVSLAQLVGGSIPDGKHSVREGLKELEYYGYLHWGWVRNKKGHIKGRESLLKEHPTLCDSPSEPETKGVVITEVQKSDFGEPETSKPETEKAPEAATEVRLSDVGKSDPSNNLKKVIKKDPPLPPRGGEAEEEIMNPPEEDKPKPEPIQAEEIPDVETALLLAFSANLAEEDSHFTCATYDDMIQAQAEAANKDDEGDIGFICGAYDDWIGEQLDTSGCDPNDPGPGDDFDTYFGDLYPEKSGMTAARRLWVKKPFLPDEKVAIMTAIRWHLQHNPRWSQSSDGRYYLPAANKWLKDECWKDPLPGPKLVGPSKRRDCEHDDLDKLEQGNDGSWVCFKPKCLAQLSPAEVASRGLPSEPPEHDVPRISWRN